MSWEEEWPGEPYEPVTTGRVPEDAPFRVALKRSAREAATEIETLGATAGNVVTYDSRAEAVEKLIRAIDCPGLRFQRPAPNDPADVDAYLVKVRDPRPEPDERDSPTTGWSFDMRAQQVGALTEALFGAYRWDPPPILAYAARDLGADPEELRIGVEDTPSSVGGLDPTDGQWVPDFEFVARQRTDAGTSGCDGPVLCRYFAEVKHGSTRFERSQRTQMAALADRGPRVDVLVIRVDLSGVPQTYDLSIRSVARDGFGD